MGGRSDPLQESVGERVVHVGCAHESSANAQRVFLALCHECLGSQFSWRAQLPCRKGPTHHNYSLTELYIHAASSRGESWAHHVGTLQHLPNGAFVHLHLWQHVGIYAAPASVVINTVGIIKRRTSMQHPQSWEVGAISVDVEEDSLIFANNNIHSARADVQWSATVAAAAETVAAAATSATCAHFSRPTTCTG